MSFFHSGAVAARLAAIAIRDLPGSEGSGNSLHLIPKGSSEMAVFER